jgi:outer membrane protein OmpA-like peptidoglycan-associated protein
MLLVPLSAAFALDAHGFEYLGTRADSTAYTRLGTPTAGRFGEWDAGLVMDYASAPLAEVMPWGRQPVLDQLATLNLGGGYSLGSLRLDAALPVYASGTDPSGSFSVLGDARLGALVPVLRPRGWIPALSVQAHGWLPTGSEVHHLGSIGPRAGADVLVGQEVGPVGLIAMLGAEAGLAEEDRNVDGGFGPLAGLGGAYRVTDAISCALEVTAQGALESLPVEGTLSARYRGWRGGWAVLGAAAGLGDAPGAARWRAFAGLGWSGRRPEPVAVIAEDPNADRDGDGIPDVRDACKDQPETFDGFDDEDGCPELDGDGDGVPFEKDRCPQEPIRPEQDPRYSDGCPKVAEFAGTRIAVTETIFFREGRAELLPSAEPVLSAVAAVMTNHAEIDHFLVEGHTNRNGSDAYNVRLSDARAFAVMGWLVAHGVPAERLLSKGFGESRPLIEYDAPDAEKINRRVEFRVVHVEEIPPDARKFTLPGEVR